LYRREHSVALRAGRERAARRGGALGPRAVSRIVSRARAGFAPLSVVVASAAWLAGCSVGLGGTVLHSPAPANTHAGVTLSGRVHLPREYDSYFGAEAAFLPQARPGTPVDQGRVGLLLGYGQAPVAYGPVIGWEATARGGFLRGSMGRDVLLGGGYAGASFGLPLRLTRGGDAWEEDGYLRAELLLVPSVHGGAVLGQAGGVLLRGEVAAALEIRARLWPTLVP
jgi:hypothetical protein